MNYESPVNRTIEIGAGLGLTLIGLPFFLIGGAEFWALVFREIDKSVLALAIVGFVTGAFCVWTGIRMVFGFKRRDGGLLSPFILRLGALFFAIVPIILWFVSDGGSWRTLWFVLEIAFYFSAAGACLLLANRRQHSALSQDSVRNDAYQIAALAARAYLSRALQLVVHPCLARYWRQ